MPVQVQAGCRSGRTYARLGRGSSGYAPYPGPFYPRQIPWGQLCSLARPGEALPREGMSVAALDAYCVATWAPAVAATETRVEHLVADSLGGLRAGDAYSTSSGKQGVQGVRRPHQIYAHGLRFPLGPILEAPVCRAVAFEPVAEAEKRSHAAVASNPNNPVPEAQMRRGCSAGVGNLWAAAGENMERQVTPSGSKLGPGRVHAQGHGQESCIQKITLHFVNLDFVFYAWLAPAEFD